MPKTILSSKVLIQSRMQSGDSPAEALYKVNNQLLNEVHGISRNRAEDLRGIGIDENEDGTLTLDRKRLASAVGPADAKKTFKILNRFKEDLSREANKTSVNPLNYVDKVTVEYKDPKNVFTAPYASSVYSGLLLDLSL